MVASADGKSPCRPQSRRILVVRISRKMQLRISGNLMLLNHKPGAKQEFKNAHHMKPEEYWFWWVSQVKLHRTLRANRSQKHTTMSYSHTRPGMCIPIWVVIKIMAPFWIPIIIRPLIFRVPQKGTIILTTNHLNYYLDAPLSRLLVLHKLALPTAITRT